MKKILITGGSGFIGKHLIAKLKQENCEMMIISRTNYKSQIDKQTWLKTNIKDIKLNIKKIVQFNPDICIHLAWKDIPDFRIATCIENLTSSISFLSEIINNTKCKKFILGGSCLEYGNFLGERTEEQIIKNINYFTWAKNSLREWIEVEAIKNNLEYVWLRMFYVYGENQRSNSLIPSLISKIKKKEVINIRTPFDANDFIHVKDVANAIYLSAVKKIDNGVYNLSSGYSIKNIDILKTIEKKINNSSDIYNDLLSRKIFEDPNRVDFWGNCQKLTNKINWKPKRNIYKQIEYLCEFIN